MRRKLTLLVFALAFAVTGFALSPNGNIKVDGGWSPVRLLTVFAVSKAFRSPLRRSAS